MSCKAIKILYQIHKWTSLVCAVFVLLLCLTGLPLIFSAEPGASNTRPLANLPANTTLVSLDKIAAISREMYPGQSIQSVRLSENNEPLVYVEVTAAAAQRGRWLTLDSRTAQVLEEFKPSGRRHMMFMDIMHGLHCDLFAGQIGEWLLVFMCLLFLVALASGVVLYDPFMKTQTFGAVRLGPPRHVWLDWHKMLGIVVLVWAIFTSHIGAAILIEATTGELTEMPWYLKALSIARPLHLDNYSTLPLKILWAVLDILAIGMLVSGIYAWLLKHRRYQTNPTENQSASKAASFRTSHRQIWAIPNDILLTHKPYPLIVKLNKRKFLSNSILFF